VPLETYATIKAQIWDRPAAIADILEEHSLDETTWRAIEIRQSLDIARDASSGSGKLAVKIRQAVSDARRRVAGAKPDEPKLDLDDFAALRVAIDEVDDPTEILESHGLTPAAWERLQRSWSHRAKADARIAGELRRKMADARLKANERDS
jgi:hypothetical protein